MLWTDLVGKLQPESRVRREHPAHINGGRGASSSVCHELIGHSVSPVVRAAISPAPAILTRVVAVRPWMRAILFIAGQVSPLRLFALLSAIALSLAALSVYGTLSVPSGARLHSSALYEIF